MNSLGQLTFAALVSLGCSCSPAPPMGPGPVRAAIQPRQTTAARRAEASTPAVKRLPVPADHPADPALDKDLEPAEITSVRLEWLVVPVDHSEDLSLGLQGGTVWVSGHNSDVTTKRDFFVASLSQSDGALQRFEDGTGRFVRDFASNEQATYLLTEFSGQVQWGPLSVRSRGSSDVFLARLGSDGLPLWGAALGNATFDRAYEVSVAPDGGALVLSSHIGPLEHNGQNVPAVGREDAVLTRWNPDGHLSWATNLGTKQVDRGRAMALTEASEAFVVGTRYQTDILGPDAQASAPSRGFVARLTASGERVWLKELGHAGGHVELDKVGLAPEGARLAVGGEFFGRAHLGDIVLERAPKMREQATSFVALLSGDGEVLWAQTAPKVRCWLSVGSEALVVATNEGVLKLRRHGEAEVIATWGHHDFLKIWDCRVSQGAWYVSGLVSEGSPFLGQPLPPAHVVRFPQGSGIPAGYSAFVAKLIPNRER